jgi:enoyl-CoA hydratase/carnithine racemase
VTDPAVKVVWLDNPPVNAINADVIGTLRGALEGLAEETRVLVLRGKGERAFSAGANVALFQEPGGGGLAGEIQAVASLIESAPVPVIAAIHGYCLGGGLEVALACDLRIAHADAQLGLPEVSLGLLPGGGGSQRAPRLIGPGRARWLLMTGERIPARQAEAWGLVEVVTDDLDATLDRVGGMLAAHSRRALREIKQLMYATRDHRSDEQELEAFVRCLESADGQEGVAAFLEKRKPIWSGS